MRVYSVFYISAELIRCPVILYPPIKTIRGRRNLSPRMEITGIQSIYLKIKIRHTIQNVNAKVLQCQCIVSERSCGPLPYTCIFNIYLFSADQSFKKTGLEDLKQSLCLCILWFCISITISNYQLHTFIVVAHGKK